MSASADPWAPVTGGGGIWPSPSQETLLRAALLRDERATQAWREIRPSIDVARLDGSIMPLLPILRRNLMELGVEDELFGLFKGVHRYGWARTQMLLAPLLPVLAALEASGMPTMVLKGAAMLADRRLDGGLRTMGDIDVMVPTERRGDAVEVLLEHGLVPVDGAAPWYVIDHVPDYSPSYGFRDERDRQLDLHWHVLHASCQPGADDDFWAAAREVDLHGVRTRALCPADELLLVVLHGLRWSDVPSHRWIVDASLLASGTFGAIDYDRLVDQAIRRRVSVGLRAGLAYLQRIAGSPIPPEAMRALDGARPSRLERLELRAQTTQPRRRTRWGRQVLLHEQDLRRHLPIGMPPTPLRRLRAERRRRGVGPGRPASTAAAPVGNGHAPRDAGAVKWGAPLVLSDPAVVRAIVAYGTWRAEKHGCWLAGREARLVLALAEPARSSLLLEVCAEPLRGPGIAPQRVALAVNGKRAGVIACDDLHASVLVLPRAAVAGRDRLDLVLRTYGAISPAAAGIGDDDRVLGVGLQRLTLREPQTLAVGESARLGTGGDDVSMVVDGWYPAERNGRWTRGVAARLLVRLEDGARPSMLELDADALQGPGFPAPRLEIRLGGRRAGTLAAAGPQRVAVRPEDVADGEVLIEILVDEPRSPHAIGEGEDRRALGLFVRRLTFLD